MPTDPTSDARGEKARLRREMRARRLAFPAKEARSAAIRALHRLWSLPILSRARRIALYLPVRGELDCTPLAAQAWRRGRTTFLPVVAGDTLRFAPFSADSRLRPNRFGILEPGASVRHWVGARQLDVIVAPLVAFDEQTNRLGMGGGYYDRTLAFLTQRSSRRRPHFVALAFEMQRITALPADAWDVRLDAVITEERTYRFT
jgi:5-formyltetrahydrofolate cyclo-ligase